MPLACMILHASRYYANQLRKDKRTDERVTSMRAQLVRLDPGARCGLHWQCTDVSSA